jgi:repressor LexA
MDVSSLEATVMESLTKAQKELYDWLVVYIRQNQHAPSIRQMMLAMNLRSPAPIQSRLEHMRNKGYIEWDRGKARTISISHTDKGLPIHGAIAAGGAVESFGDDPQYLDVGSFFIDPSCYGLRVTGDSMIGASIVDGDTVILKKIDEPDTISNASIVAAHVEGMGTTLKEYHRHGDRTILRPANPNYQPIEVPANQVQLQGLLVAVWRNCR